ncbi:MAG: hypothetical protein KGI69_01955 [Patescibacteria group bacterium]|nr:hypothetical protein [Patescibacteria group bacterium]
MKKTTKKAATRKSPRKGVATNAAAPESEIKENLARERGGDQAVFRIQRLPECLTAEAYRWVMNPGAIPMAGYAPIRFVGWKVIRAFHEVMGHPLSLEDVHMLVQQDGDLEMCAIDNIQFQPVRYAPFVPQEIEQSLRDGTPLAEVRLYYGGAFFQDNKIQGGKIIPVSGCVFNSRDEICKGSPLVVASKTLGLRRKGKGGISWGECLDRIKDRMADRVKGREDYRRRVDKAHEIFGVSRQNKGGTLRRQHRHSVPEVTREEIEEHTHKDGGFKIVLPQEAEGLQAAAKLHINGEKGQP